MKDFSNLITQLDQTNKTNEKVNHMVDYFKTADEKEKIWALYLLSGQTIKRQVNSTIIKQWTTVFASIPFWLFEECYSIVGDLSETIALLISKTINKQNKNSVLKGKNSLSELILSLINLNEKNEEEKKSLVFFYWSTLDKSQLFVFNKLLLGNFRIGVSKNLLVRALSKIYNLEASIIQFKLMGNWNPINTSISELIENKDEHKNLSKPFPFFLASPLEQELNNLGDPEQWQVEWKWDGIRAQIIKRENNIFVWSRGEELITDKFPEFNLIKDKLEEGIVIDGEILPYINKPLSFNILQTRIGRKNLNSKILQEAPVVLFAYDLIEFEGKDIRKKTLFERRNLLEEIVKKINSPTIIISPTINFNKWEDLKIYKDKSRESNAEGLMLKKNDSTYQVGRKRGDWWKWKIDPLTIDGVLLYAQRGHGRRANLYTDYTFAVWDDDNKLVPFTKAYSGLTDEEISDVNKFILKNTIEKFGPVRSVNPELVFEIAFEGIQLSRRHKSGIALRFPRILRWRHDKKMEEADTLLNLQNILKNINI